MLVRSPGADAVVDVVASSRKTTPLPPPLPSFNKKDDSPHSWAPTFWKRKSIDWPKEFPWKSQKEDWPSGKLKPGMNPQCLIPQQQPSRQQAYQQPRQQLRQQPPQNP